MNVNVLIVTRNGIIETPIVVLDETTAQAEFNKLVDEFVNDEEKDEINLHFDSQIDDLNKLINPLGINVDWFVDVEINDYLN